MAAKVSPPSPVLCEGEGSAGGAFDGRATSGPLPLAENRGRRAHFRGHPHVRQRIVFAAISGESTQNLDIRRSLVRQCPSRSKRGGVSLLDTPAPCLGGGRGSGWLPQRSRG